MLRVPDMISVQPMTADSIEILNIAENLRSGRGFLLDIKSTYAIDEPVTHYAFFCRPMFLPILLAIMQSVMPDRLAFNMLGTLLFVCSLFLVYQALDRLTGKNTATFTCLLLASHPYFYHLTELPADEMGLVFILGAILWSHVCAKSVVLTGLACLAAVFVHPLGIIPGLVVGVRALHTGLTHREWMPLAIHAAVMLVCLLWVIVLNHIYGAPWSTFPGKYFFHVMDAADMSTTFYQYPPYDDMMTLIAHESPTILHRSLLNLKTLGFSMINLQGLVFLIPLVPLAWSGFRHNTRLKQLTPLAGVATGIMAVHCLAWSNPHFFPASGTLVFSAIILVITGCFEILDREPVIRNDKGGYSAGNYVCLAILSCWIMLCLKPGLDMASSDTLYSRYVYSDFNMKDDNSIDRQALMKDPSGAEDGTIIIGNNPWMAWHLTRLPAAMLPSDMGPAQARVLIDSLKASVVLIDSRHESPMMSSGSDSLLLDLENRGWDVVEHDGMFEILTRTDIQPMGGSTDP
jgi:hypothetical protein